MSATRRLIISTALVGAALLLLSSPAAGAEGQVEPAWQSCSSFTVVSYSGDRYDILDLEEREASCSQAGAVVRSFHSQVIGSSGATVAEGFGCAYEGNGDRVLCKSFDGSSYNGPIQIRWRLRAADVGGSGGAHDVASCRPFTVYRGHSSSGDFSYRASSVERTVHISCSLTRKLLKASYGGGPLHVVRTVYPDVGRPTYWLRGGWRCSNGAGGASCWNARKPRLNVIRVDGLTHGLAVQADVTYR